MLLAAFVPLLTEANSETPTLAALTLSQAAIALVVWRGLLARRYAELTQSTPVRLVEMAPGVTAEEVRSKTTAHYEE